MSEIALQRHLLSNGLNVLTIPSKQAPVVAVQGWIRFGAADEPEDVAGLAHLFEHLLFKGTARRKVGQIASEIEGLGGDLNAFTSYDQTVMHMTLASQHLDQGIDILADSLMNSVVDDDELARERVVVLEEIKRRNDMPGAIASDLFRRELFAGHPYARPVIGYPSVVEAMSRERIMTLYKKHYHAKNIFLVIAGDFNTDALLKSCEKHFRGLRSGTPSATLAEPPAITHQRHSFSNHNSPNAILHVGWQAPDALSPDAATLDAFALILGQGESSRMYRKIVLDEKLARDCGAACWTPKYRGSFDLYFKGQGLSKSFQRLLTLTRECMEAPVSESELEKAKKNLLASATYSKETVDGLANRFGYFECLKGWEADEEYMRRVRDLHVEQIEEARLRFFDWNQVVAGGVFPENERIPSFEVPKKLQPKLSKAEKVLESQQGVEKFRFRDLTVLVKTLPHLPIFCARWLSLGGSRIENPKLAGIGNLWARCVTNGAWAADGKFWGQHEIMEFMDQSSASLNAFYGKNSAGFYLDGLSDDFERLFNVLAAVKERPAFNESLMKDEKKRQLHDIKSSKDQPGAVVNLLFSQALYGANHPYGRPSLGEEGTVAKIKVKDLQTLHAKLEKEPQVLSIVGKISVAQVKALLEKYFASKRFKRQSPLLKDHPKSPPTKPISVRKIMKKEQTHILLGYPACTIHHKDRHALSALSAVLSGQSGRLFIELRDKMSLCYTVSPSLMTGFDGSHFAFYIATSPEKESIAIEALHKEIARLIHSGVSEEEWQRARSFYTGNYQLEQQRFAAQAMGMALDELYGFGYEEYFKVEEHLNKVKTEDLQKMAEKYFGSKASKHLVCAVVGPGPGPGPGKSSAKGAAKK